MSNKCPLGIWRFTDKSIKNMNNLINKTRKIGIEYGAIIEGEHLKNKSVLNLGKECTGYECTVKLPEKTKKEYVGEFHTHPSGSAKPSPADLLRFEYVGDIICVGAPQNNIDNKMPPQNKINCYNRRFSVYGIELFHRRKYVLDDIMRNIERKKVFTKEDRERRDMILENDFNEFSPDQCKSE